MEGVERGLVAHGLAGKPHAGRCRARRRCRESKIHTAFRPALGCEGRVRKAVLGERRRGGGKKSLC